MSRRHPSSIPAARYTIRSLYTRKQLRRTVAWPIYLGANITRSGTPKTQQRWHRACRQLDSRVKEETSYRPLPAAVRRFTEESIWHRYIPPFCLSADSRQLPLSQMALFSSFSTRAGMVHALSLGTEIASPSTTVASSGTVML